MVQVRVLYFTCFSFILVGCLFTRRWSTPPDLDFSRWVVYRYPSCHIYLTSATLKVCENLDARRDIMWKTLCFWRGVGLRIVLNEYRPAWPWWKAGGLRRLSPHYGRCLSTFNPSWGVVYHYSSYVKRPISAMLKVSESYRLKDHHTATGI